MRTQPVALKHTQHHSRIPQTHPLRKRVRLARQTVQTIPQHPIQPLAVNPIRTRNRRTQYTQHLHTHHLAPTTTLDRLCQAHSRRRHSARTTALAQTLRIPIHAPNRLPIDHPPIPDPRYALVSRRPSPVRSHRPMVSCLCAMMFSAALRLPRRITTSRVRATSVGGCKRSIGVPKAAPKERLQVRQVQRCRLFLLAFLTISNGLAVQNAPVQPCIRAVVAPVSLNPNRLLASCAD